MYIRRKQMYIKEKSKVMIYFEKATHIKLKHLAVDLDTSVTAIIREAIDDYLKKYKKGVKHNA